MNKEIITTDKAPAPIGPYSQALKIKCSELIFTSGQIPIDPQTNEIVQGGIKEQTHRAIQSLKAVLEQGGSSLDNVVKTTVYLSDINNFAEMNNIYNEYFGSSKPSRSTIQAAALPKGAMFEIDAIATL